MDGVTFSREMKGYAKQEVERYIDLIQKSFKKLETDKKSKETELEKVQNKMELTLSELKEETYRDKELIAELQLQLENTGSMEKLESYKSELLASNEAIKSDLDKVLGEYESLRIEHEKTLADKTEVTAELAKMKEQLDLFEKQLETGILTEHEKEDSAYLEELRLLRAENASQRNDIVRYRKEKEEEIKLYEAVLMEKEALLSEIESLKVTKETEKVDDSVQLSQLFISAKKQADEYMKNVHIQMESEMKAHKAEMAKIKKDAEKEASEIKKAARQTKVDEFAEEKKKFEKERQEAMTECEYMKQEAEADRISAKHEAESIIRQAQLKLELAAEKDKLIVARASAKAKRIEEDMNHEYDILKVYIQDTAERLSNMFAFVADLDNIKDADRIRQFTKEGITADKLIGPEAPEAPKKGRPKKAE